MRVRRWSINVKLILLVEIIVLVINGTLAFLIYQNMHSIVREINRAKLKSIAATTASLLPVDDHEAILSEEDRDTSAYQGVKNLFTNIKSANPMVYDIYSLRPTEDENVWTFVVGEIQTEDSNQDGVIQPDEEGVAIGEKYDVSDLPDMKEAIKKATADHETSCDKWGCWLSGYAPVRNPDGELVALIGVDISSEEIVVYERKSKMILASVLLGMLFLMPMLLLVFLRKNIQPLFQIIEALKIFEKELSYRLDIRSGDEFELLSNAFNSMAAKIQHLEQGLERKVDNKTKALATKVDEAEHREAKDEALLSSIGEGLIAIDNSRRIMLVNQQAEKILDLTKDNMIGKRYTEVIHLQDEMGLNITGAHSPMEVSLADKLKTHASYYVCTSKGCIRTPVTITSSPVILGGKTIGCIVVFRDITEEKKIDQAKTEFVSLASHQLRTPLAAMNWYIEFLSDQKTGKLNTEQKKSLKRLHRLNTRMVELVQSLLNVSRLDLGTFMIENQKINLAEMGNKVLRDLKAQIGKKKLKVTYHHDNQVPLMNADPQLVRIIFENLIANAVKYTPAGGSIAIKLELDADEEVVFSVSDTGYGIPEAQQQMIFTKLFRADNAKAKVQDGTGLGLYMVKSIVTSSGGKIWFQSKENEGSTFSVSYPLSGMKAKKGTKRLG